MDVKFTSDSSVTRSGFRLNIRSIPCGDRDNFPETESTEEYSGFGGMNHGCDVQEVHIATEEVLEGTIVTNTESDGNYPNYACQQWNIIGDENQVCVLCQSLQLSLFYFNKHNPYM